MNFNEQGNGMVMPVAPMNGGFGNSSIDHLQTMVDNAKNDRERMMYQRWLDEARQNL